MAEDHTAESIKDFNAWLEKDDEKGRAMRAMRLRDLVEILPISSESLMFFGGDKSLICFDEVRRCYLDGSYMAVVLLCLIFVEEELAAELYATGWNSAKKARFGDLLEKAHEKSVISDFEWQTYEELARYRNSHAHFRAPSSPTSLLARTVEEDSTSREVLWKDARRAIQAMARTVKRRSGSWVTIHGSSLSGLGN